MFAPLLLKLLFAFGQSYALQEFSSLWRNADFFLNDTIKEILIISLIKCLHFSTLILKQESIICKFFFFLLIRYLGTS